MILKLPPANSVRRDAQVRRSGAFKRAIPLRKNSASRLTTELVMFAWLRRWLPCRDGSFGDRGEHAAERFLAARGCRIVARQHRNSGGELDLVAIDGDTVVFVEVKTRGNDERSRPTEAITPDKQRRLTRAALAFLKQRGWLERRCRFDVVAVVWPNGERAPQIAHYPNAFEATGRGQMF